MPDPLASAAQLVPGYRLDRYELLCPVARGGMAAVWLARFKGKHGFEKLVAVKTILPLYAAEPEFRRMFLDEAGIASRIEHVNVAQILDLGEQDGILYLVMEWVDGDSLSRLARTLTDSGAIMPPALALRVVSDSCEGLHAAHELCDAQGHALSVVHRDVSPQNILLSSKGAIKLIDFGIAKARDRASEDTRVGTFKGKIHYMAPEQALGKPIDRRADVWAVAAVLYRLLAQRTVYDGEGRLDALRNLTSNALILPLPAGLPPELARVVFKALSWKPEARYESCAELHDELETVIRVTGLGATPGELGAFVNRHLGERFEARRRTIATALQSVSENSTVRTGLPADELLESESESESESEVAATAVLTPMPGADPLDMHAEPTRRWSATPHALSAGSTSPEQRGARATARKALWFGVVAVTLLLGLWLRQRTTASSAPVVAATLATGTEHAAPSAAESASAAPSAAPDVVQAPEPVASVEVVSVESLALAQTATATSKATQRATKAKPAVPVSAAHAKPPKRRVVDDGF